MGVGARVFLRGLGVFGLLAAWVSLAQSSQPSAALPLDTAPTSQPVSLLLSLPSSQPITPSSAPSNPPKEHESRLTFEGRKRPWVLAVLPLPVFSSDNGVGGALQASLYDHRKEVKPYDALYEVLALAASKGVQIYIATVELPGLVHGKYRLKLQGAYLNDPNRYYGLGNESVRDPELEAQGFYECPFQTYGGLVTLRRRLIGPFEVVGFAQEQRYNPRPAEFALLDNPVGIEGNWIAQLGLGLLRDTRDHEASPRHGSFQELSIRGAPDLLNEHPFFATTFITRHYFTFGPDITLGGRFVFDAIFGDAPFTIQDKFGIDGVYSLGGGRSLRGYPEGRYLGKIKALTNIELRALPLTKEIKGLRFDLGAALFLDAGRVLTDINTPLNGLNPHLGIGGGLRVLYEKDFVVRFDIAHSEEDSVRLYLDIGHIF